MTEIKKTLTILKARWPEVTIFISLNVFLILANKLFKPPIIDLWKPFHMVYAAISIALTVVSAVFGLGLLRTVFLEETKRQNPLVLLRIGCHFFWRMFAWGLIWVIVLLILSRLTFQVVRLYPSIDTGFFETAKSSPLVFNACFIVPNLILIKPFLLIPAIIIVLNCGISESWRSLKYCKLLEAKELVLLFCLQITLPFLWAFVRTLDTSLAISLLALGASSVVTYLLFLIVRVIAIRFVASHDLVCDDDSDYPHSRDLRKEQLYTQLED